MKALVYDGPREVHVKDVPDARIEQPTDVLVKITSTNICGSDLHMYEGRTDLERELTDGRELLLPAVTFSTLPLLTEVSEGRVPNPYA